MSRAREIFGRLAGPASEPEPGPAPESNPEPTTSLELVPPLPAGEREPERPIYDHGERPASPVLRLIEQTRAEREARGDRVAGLFPPPETTEWKVRDITYDRSRRAEVTPE
jgi:hypothetical protein